MKTYVSVENKWFSRIVYRDSYGKTEVVTNWSDNKPVVPVIEDGNVVEKFTSWRSVAFTGGEFDRLFAGSDDRFTLKSGAIDTLVRDNKIYISMKDLDMHDNVVISLE